MFSVFLTYPFASVPLLLLSDTKDTAKKYVILSFEKTSLFSFWSLSDADFRRIAFAKLQRSKEIETSEGPPHTHPHRSADTRPGLYVHRTFILHIMSPFHFASLWLVNRNRSSKNNPLKVAISAALGSLISFQGKN